MEHSMAGCFVVFGDMRSTECPFSLISLCILYANKYIYYDMTIPQLFETRSEWHSLDRKPPLRQLTSQSIVVIIWSWKQNSYKCLYPVKNSWILTEIRICTKVNQMICC